MTLFTRGETIIRCTWFRDKPTVATSVVSRRRDGYSALEVSRNKYGTGLATGDL